MYVCMYVCMCVCLYIYAVLLFQSLFSTSLSNIYITKQYAKCYVSGFPFTKEYVHLNVF